MNNKWKNTLKRIAVITFWVGTGIGFTALFASALNEHKGAKVQQVKVSIDQGDGIFFVNSDDIFDIINTHYPGGLVGVKLDSLHLKELEKAISRNPFISNAEMYATIRGDVVVKVKQREPILRVINSNRVSFYIDRNGEKMPASSKFTVRVPVFYGNIPISAEPAQHIADSAMYQSIYRLGSFINNSLFWNAQVEQIYVNEKSEFEIIPMLGNQGILLGNAEQLDEKFKRAMIFYKEVLKNIDAPQYATVNVKYKDQIICTKSN